MTKVITKNIRISRVWCCFLCYNYWVNWKSFFGELRVVFEHFEDLKKLILKILKEGIDYILPRGLFLP